MKQNGTYHQADNKEMSLPLTSPQDSEDDSDAKQLFELPKRKIIRPPTASLKRRVTAKGDCSAVAKKCCSVFLTTVLPLALAIFIVSMILCVAMLLVGISNMKNDFELLKVKVNNVEDSERTSLNRNKELRMSFQRKLDKLEQQQAALHSLQKKVDLTYRMLFHLNETVYTLKQNPSLFVSKDIDVIVQDLDTLKTGMADTGADIEELKANNKKDKVDLLQLQSVVHNIQLNVYNLTVDLSAMENKPRPSRTTTPKTLVVTLTPDEDMPVKRKELTEILEVLKAKELDMRNAQQLKYMLELENIKNSTKREAELHEKDIAELKEKFEFLSNTEKVALNESKKIVHKLSSKNVSYAMSKDVERGQVKATPASIKPEESWTTLSSTTAQHTHILKTDAPVTTMEHASVDINESPNTNQPLSHTTKNHLSVVNATSIPTSTKQKAEAMETRSVHKTNENTDAPYTESITDYPAKRFDRLESIPGDDLINRKRSRVSEKLPVDEHARRKYLQSLNNAELQQLLLTLKHDKRQNTDQDDPFIDDEGDDDDGGNGYDDEDMDRGAGQPFES